jgi:signal peptidase II
LQPVNSIAILGDFFKLTYAENTGSAFSQFQGQNSKIVYITIACLIFLIFAIKTSKSRVEKLGYFLVTCGAIGNLADRIFRGHVTDFFDFDFFDILIRPNWIFGGVEMYRWPVFNMADSYICVGVCIVLMTLVYDAWKNKKVKVA